MDITDALVMAAAKLVIENRELREKVVELTKQIDHLNNVLYEEVKK